MTVFGVDIFYTFNCRCGKAVTVNVPRGPDGGFEMPSHALPGGWFSIQWNGHSAPKISEQVCGDCVPAVATEWIREAAAVRPGELVGLILRSGGGSSR